MKTKYMGFSFSKLFNKTASDANTSDTIDAIIETVENTPYGVSDTNVLFAGLNELGGYYFFQTVIVGTLNVKSKKGAQLSFKGDTFELILDSDIQEFESDHTDVKGRYVTKIDFQIEESDIENLQNTELRTVLIKVKNQKLEFKKYKIHDEEE
ncbi:hypothetical protein [Winogradskyella flava]|uniref:Uncharacterized protein n=1 Tax=Winogradskyella flava TaxID=1884876 RepID=A0A842ITB5_9FLAO|nr:hypothetical protein [Winogradskyella flava]MBC2846131.1 hypothetical protein [Winogradskyella flava]